jgi:ankyrin repeat protein
MVRRLLKKEADIAAKDKEGRTALHLVAGVEKEGVSNYESPSDDAREVVAAHLLLEKCADVNVKYGHGLTALQRATKNGHKTTVRLLTPLTTDS